MSGPTRERRNSDSMIGALEAGASHSNVAQSHDFVAPKRIDLKAIEAILNVRGHGRSAIDRLRASIEYDTIDACVDCGGSLGLPAPKVGLPTETWRCASCHAVFITGVTDESFTSQGVAQRAHRNEQAPLAQMPASQPATRRRLLSRLCAGEYLDKERRRHPRHAVSALATATAMDSMRRAVRLPIRITTRDISLTGVSGYCEHPIVAPLLLIDFTAAGCIGWQVAIELVRQKPTGFLHEFGGAFIGE